MGPALLLVASVVLVHADHPRRAAVALAGGVLTAVVALASPRVRDAADRVVPAVAGGLGWLLLAPAYFLVVTPLGRLLRLAGTPPLDVPLDSHRISYWSARAPARGSRPGRPFVDERRWRPVGSSPLQRRRLVVRSLMAVVLIEAMLAGGVYVIDRRRSAPAPPTGVSVVSPGRPAALRGQDWVDDALAEQARLTRRIVYTPFTGPALRDFRGRYINVANRVRASYRSPLALARPPVKVWVFGGSTTFGFDLQRDGHTIPSELVRLAEDRGIAVEVRNYGMAGYVNYQETLLLSLLVTSGDRPDVVVFYDGVNDSGLGISNALVGTIPRGEPGEIEALRQRRALAAELQDLSAEPPAPLGLRPDGKPVTLDQLVGDIVGVYLQGVELGRTLAGRYGFHLVHFWQPDIFTKRPLDPAERDMYASLVDIGADYDKAVRFSARVRQALPDGVIDISGALDHVSGPVLSDLVHTNEQGARAVAEAMYRHLEPQLVELSSRS